MDTFAPIALMYLGPLLVAIITSMNAKKTNEMWRKRRAARLAARAGSNG